MALTRDRVVVSVCEDCDLEVLTLSFRMSPKKLYISYCSTSMFYFNGTIFKRGGDWQNGGNCHLETLPELCSSLVPNDNWLQFKIMNVVLSAHTNVSEIVFIMLSINKPNSFLHQNLQPGTKETKFSFWNGIEC
ncbi:Trichome birefringence-like family [Vigna unguiculata]|uniref:Trichome birefringence-like family n=1 Tax=Vigna unguiculata TaxID=3917 RepID=A0A4D6N998_VIGUN|nr:Trichome birefringence-like family [Vigna unguiculata]